MNTVNFDFTGATVLVTGGTSGIGNAIAAAFAGAGAAVTVTGTRGSATDYSETDLSAYTYRQCQIRTRNRLTPWRIRWMNWTS